MPVIKCSNGKYRIGKGKCMYDTFEKAQKSYHGYLAFKYGKVSETTLFYKHKQLLKEFTQKNK